MTADVQNSMPTPTPYDKPLDCRTRSPAWRGAASWALVSVWLAGTGYAFWSFELGEQRAFESPRTVLFDSGSRAKSAEAWFQVSIAPLANSGTPVVAAARPAAAGSVTLDTVPQGLRRLALPTGDALSWIDATPAALVYDASGRLVYFGPYSDSARCGESGGLVERVLDRVLLGQTPHPQPFYGGGCFCGEKREI
jgi:hypothetical protein